MESASPAAKGGNLFVSNTSAMEPTSAGAALNKLPLGSFVSPIKIPRGGAYIGHSSEKDQGFLGSPRQAQVNQ